MATSGSRYRLNLKPLLNRGGNEAQLARCCSWDRFSHSADVAWHCAYLYYSPQSYRAGTDSARWTLPDFLADQPKSTSHHAARYAHYPATFKQHTTTRHQRPCYPGKYYGRDGYGYR